jgi:hypothetical protein
MEVVADAQLPAVFPVREEVVPEVTEEAFMAEGVARGNHGDTQWTSPDFHGMGSSSDQEDGGKILWIDTQENQLIPFFAGLV